MPFKLLCLLLPLLSLLAACTSTPEFRDAPGEVTGLRTHVPFRLVGDPRFPVPAVDAEINCTPGLFAIDTGSPDTELSSDFCRRAGLIPDSRGNVHVDSLRVGSVTFRNFDAVCNEKLNPHLTPDGLIGCTPLLGTTFTINPRDQYLSWGESGTGQPISVDAQCWGMTGAPFRVTVDTRLNGYTSGLVLDTGSSITRVSGVGLGADAPGFHHATLAPEHAWQTFKPTSTTIKMEVDYLPDAELVICDYGWHERQTVKLKLVVKGDDNTYVLGYDALSQFIVTIDAKNKNLYLTPLAPTPRPPSIQPTISSQ